MTSFVGVIGIIFGHLCLVFLIINNLPLSESNFVLNNFYQNRSSYKNLKLNLQSKFSLYAH